MVEVDIKNNIEKEQDKQSQHYDKKHGAGSSFIKGGSIVLKKNFLRKKNTWWLFLIIKSLGKGLFKLQEIDGSKVNLNILTIILILVCIKLNVKQFISSIL